jgi:hypothetical protein
LFTCVKVFCYGHISDELSFALFSIVLQIIIFGDQVILDDPIEMYVLITQVIDNLIMILRLYIYPHPLYKVLTLG